MVSSLKNYIIILYYYFISLYMSRITRTTNWALDWPDDVCFEYKTGEGKKEHGKGNEGKQNCLWSYEEARERREENRTEQKRKENYPKISTKFLFTIHKTEKRVNCWNYHQPLWWTLLFLLFPIVLYKKEKGRKRSIITEYSHKKTKINKSRPIAVTHDPWEFHYTRLLC